MLRLPTIILLVFVASCGSDPAPGADGAPPPDQLVPDGHAEVATGDGLASDSAAPDTGQADSVPDTLTADLPPADAPSTPPGCVQGTFQPYFGNFHAHTSHSDGAQTPDDAFKYARDVAKLDIMVLTDHLEQLYLVPPLDRYGSCKTAAAAQTTTTYLAACGFEYGTGFNLIFSTGHNNVFFSAAKFPAIQTDFHDFYKSLVGCTTCVGQFNHPGSEQYQHWNNFEYHSDVDERITLFELNSSAAWDLYFKALDAGWHVSPMFNQDNHSANWGTANDRRSGVFMSQLDTTALRAAMLDRRTFATNDKNAVVKVMAETVCWMGSILTQTSSVTLSVEASDADAADTFSKITLYGKAKTQLASFSCGSTNPCSATFTIQAAQSPYAVARVEQDDGGFLVAAPVWIAP